MPCGCAFVPCIYRFLEARSYIVVFQLISSSCCFYLNNELQQRAVLFPVGLSLHISSHSSSFSFEVIVVSDGSTDGTVKEVQRWSHQLGTDVVRLLELENNQGKGAAVKKVRWYLLEQ